MKNILAKATVLALATVISVHALAAPETTATTALQTITTKGLDNLQVTSSGLPAQPLQIAVTVTVSYAKQNRNPPPYYKESDFQLAPKDLEQLKKTASAAFAKELFEPRGWRLATDPAKADAQLVLEFTDFWLPAPLRESIQVSKTFTEESARFTLKGTLALKDKTAQQEQTVLGFSDKRRLHQLGVPPNRVERFTMITFWRDVNLDLGRVASLIQRQLPGGKNGQALIKSAQ